MKKMLSKKYVLGFITYYAMYIFMLLLVNWYNASNQGDEWTAIFTNLSDLDGTLAPILFAIKFLYVSTFIFVIFLLFDKKISFEAIFSAIVLSSLFYYIPQVLEFLLLDNSNEVLKYGQLKNHDWVSVIHFFPTLSDKSLLLPYLRELNIFTFFYVGLVAYLIKVEDVQFKWIFTYVLAGYFNANYFATTLLIFLTLLA